MSIKLLIHGQINLTHFLNQKLQYQIRCLHDQVSFKNSFHQLLFTAEKNEFGRIGSCSYCSCKEKTKTYEHWVKARLEQRNQLGMYDTLLSPFRGGARV